MLENKLRAMSVSFAVKTGTCSGMYGIGCCDNAWKKRTSFRSSLSENENVGMRTFKYGRTPLRFVSLVAQRGIRQESPQPFGIDARAFGQKLRRELVLPVWILILFHSHQNGLLPRNELMASHAVVLLYHPPAVLNVTAGIPGTCIGTGWVGNSLRSPAGTWSGRESAPALRCRLGMRRASVSVLILP